jgi:hypothetical protein
MGPGGSPIFGFGSDIPARGLVLAAVAVSCAVCVRVVALGVPRWFAGHAGAAGFRCAGAAGLVLVVAVAVRLRAGWLWRHGGGGERCAGLAAAAPGFRGQALGGAALDFFLPAVPCGDNPLVTDDERAPPDRRSRWCRAAGAGRRTPGPSSPRPATGWHPRTGPGRMPPACRRRLPAAAGGQPAGPVFGQSVRDQPEGPLGLPVSQQVRAVLPVRDHAQPPLVVLAQRGQRPVDAGEARGPVISAPMATRKPPAEASTPPFMTAKTNESAIRWPGTNRCHAGGTGRRPG